MLSRSGTSLPEIQILPVGEKLGELSAKGRRLTNSEIESLASMAELEPQGTGSQQQSNTYRRELRLAIKPLDEENILAHGGKGCGHRTTKRASTTTTSKEPKPATLHVTLGEHLPFT